MYKERLKELQRLFELPETSEEKLNSQRFPQSEKSVHEMRIEGKVGQPAGVFIFNKYILEGASQRTLHTELGVTREVFVRLVEKYHIPHRARSEAATVSWQDPERRNSRLKARAQPESVKRASDAQVTHHAHHPEHGQQLAEMLIARRDARARSALGGDPKEVLYRLHWQEGLLDNQIGSRYDVPPATISNWRRIYGIPNNLNIMRKRKKRS